MFDKITKTSNMEEAVKKMRQEIIDYRIKVSEYGQHAFTPAEHDIMDVFLHIVYLYEKKVCDKNHRIEENNGDNRDDDLLALEDEYYYKEG